jgi:O-Antigen ligase
MLEMRREQTSSKPGSHNLELQERGCARSVSRSRSNVLRLVSDTAALHSKPLPRLVKELQIWAKCVKIWLFNGKRNQKIRPAHGRRDGSEAVATALQGMTNPTAAFRSLMIYAICVPLALLLGYMLTTPFDLKSFTTVGVVLSILVLPLLLRFHHPLVVLGWNLGMFVFFLPGQPALWLLLVAISLVMSVVNRTIDQNYRFISVPSLTRPLLAIALVVLVTALATGGIKLRSLGGETMGGKRYIFLLAAVAGYFALTARRIPSHRAGLYVGLFILSGLTSLVGDLYYFNSHAFQVLYWFFPPSRAYSPVGLSIIRFAGLGSAALAAYAFMLAKYGIRGIFSLNKPWRLAIFAFFAGCSLLGGSRAQLILCILIFSVQFYLEGLHRTKLLPVLLLVSILAASVSIPFVQKLPYNFQRSLAFLPLKIDPLARRDAEGTADWRLAIWKAELPQVRQHFFLGKGLAMTAKDFDFSITTLQGTTAITSADQDPSALAGDYHNGPLSVIIPFGIWGVLAFLWFLAAAFRALYDNYRYGDLALRTVNAFLLAAFIANVVLFLLVFGGFYSDMQRFVGYLGLSVALNGGVARPSPEPVPEEVGQTALANGLPEHQPAFGR